MGTDPTRPAGAGAYPDDPAASWLRQFGSVDAASLRLVCFPHAGGTAAVYRPWREWLSPEIGLYAVQYPGRLDRIAAPFVADMEQLADAVTAAVCPLLDRPVALFGHSLGASVAYEVARRLPERGGAGPMWLFASGRAAPGWQRPSQVHLASDDVLWAELGRLGGTSPEVAADPVLRELFLPALRSDFRLAETYRHRPGPALSCPITVLIGDEDGEVDERQAGAWARFTRAGFGLQVFAGGHFYLLDHLPGVVGVLQRELASAIGWRLPERAEP